MPRDIDYRYAFHEEDAHAKQMFYRPALIPVFSGPALEVVSELGGQARLPCSLSSPKVPSKITPRFSLHL